MSTSEKKGSNTLPLEEQPDLNTKQAASELGLKPQTLRKANSLHGAYFGVRPRKAANGRLFWGHGAIMKLKGGAA